MEEEEESLAGIRVSQFDYSIENHFKAMDTISKLCGEEPETDSLDELEIQRLSSSITFLREWRQYNYEPRTVRFAACEIENSQERSFLGEINLPQFSSATVPKKEGLHEVTTSSESSQDFVMYVGGSVWALDWCPRADERPNSHIKCEFVAVAAHPPDSYYHNIGTLLTGRGVVQIWCILNVTGNEEELPPLKKPKRGTQNNNSAPINRPRGRPRKKQIEESPNCEATQENSTQLKRPRGRPKKQQIEESPNGEATQENSTQLKRPRGRPRKQQIEESPNGEATQENSTQCKRPKGRPRKQQIESSPNGEATKEKSTQSKRPRGQPIKTTINVNESLDSLDCNSYHVKAPAVQYAEDSSQLHAIEGVSRNTQEQTIKKNKGKQQKCYTKVVLSACNSDPEATEQNRRPKSKTRASDKCAGVICPPSLTQNKDDQSFTMNYQIDENCVQDPAVLNHGLDNVSRDIKSDPCSIPKDVALPRVVLCLAHNGKVVWDVKWRPSHASDSKCQHRMGYLAVLLGNGSLEVWDVPLPHVLKVIYSSSHGESTDPRFVKLEPVFRCSVAKCGGIQSIPLTVEWSTSCPHDYLLVGCHDGMVALWKFSVSGTSGDTRPLLCFSADTVAIRAVAWAPVESAHESVNVILTAGHGSLKFWDIRDPFRPLWELPPTKFVYSLDWLPDPRCIMLSLDDGTMRLINLMKAAYDGHVNGKPSHQSKQAGVHLLNSSSSFAIWSVQVSRKTGMVAYCGAEGTVCYFQLATKVVDLARYRGPHFMAGSMSNDGSAITVNTPLSDTPLTLKKPVKTRDDQRSMRYLLEPNQTKRANDKKTQAPAADNQQLGICDGDDPGIQSGFDETLTALESRIKPKSKKTSKKMAGEDMSMVCIDKEQDNMQERESGEGKAVHEIEVPPLKIVSLNRIRWNMNKGGERWLCSGGAAGIVRCQEIKSSDVR